MKREEKIPDKHKETRTIGKVQYVNEKKDKIVHIAPRYVTFTFALNKLLFSQFNYCPIIVFIAESF